MRTRKPAIRTKTRAGLLALAVLGLTMANMRPARAQYCGFGDSCQGLNDCVAVYQYDTCDFNCDPVCGTCYCEGTDYICDGGYVYCTDWECICVT